ncbi:MAG: hypothetical protein RSG53_07795 [Oscillospiraceae bacterium]
MNDLRMIFRILCTVTLREWFVALAFSALVVLITIGALIVGG